MLSVLPGSLLSNTRKGRAYALWVKPAPPAALSKNSQKTKPLPQVGEFVRFFDPVTENIVVRLTNPNYHSFLPASNNRFISTRDRFLIYASDRAGPLSLFRMDLHTGISTQIGQNSKLDPTSISLDAAVRFLYYLDGGNLVETNLSTRKTKTISSAVTRFSIGANATELAVVKEGKLEISASGAVLAASVDGPCGMRPGGRGCFFVRAAADGNGCEFWYASVDKSTQPVLLVRGGISNPVWSPDGRSLLFLRDVPSGNAILSEIHECIPETGLIRKVDTTSQFAAFAPNGDGSVFVGASRSKAQPTIILLLRDLQREMTLCEHRNTNPAAADPVFSPDSRRVFFQSDHEGKSALYTVNVDLLVEPTDTYKP